MGKFGAKEWWNQDHHYSQVNNPEEEQFRKLGVLGYLETCGPTAATSCIASLGHKVDIVCPGPYKSQPESMLADWFSDPNNYDRMTRVRKETPPDVYMGNRVPQFYPVAVKDVFDVYAEFCFGLHARMKKDLADGCAVLGCLLSPGHYIAVVAYDTDTKEFIFNDSWPSRSGLKNGGFNERIHEESFYKTTNNWGVVFRP